MDRSLQENLLSLEKLVDSLSLADLVEYLMFKEVCNNPNDYVEGRDTGHAPAVEHLIQLRLRARKTEGIPLLESPDLYEKALEMAKSLQLLQLFELLNDPSHTNTRSQEVDLKVPTADYLNRMEMSSKFFIRNPSYTHFGWEVLHLLFDKFATPLTSIFGFTISDIETFSNSIEACMTSACEDFMETLRAAVEKTSDASSANSSIDSTSGHDGGTSTEESYEHALSLGRPFIFSFKSLSYQSNLSDSVLRSLIEYFSTSPGDVSSDYKLLRHNGPLHQRPVIHLGKDCYVSPCHYFFPWCIQETLEKKLEVQAKISPADSKLYSKYLKHRAKCIEKSSLRFLAEAMPGSKVFHSVEYEATRHEVKARFELDIMILWDCHVLLVEVKSGGTGSAGLETSPQKLGQKFTKTYGKAQSQLDRAMDHFLGSMNPIFYSDGIEVPLDRTMFTSVIPISVSLEGFQSLTSSFGKLASSGVLSAKYVSWLVQYHDLRIVCEVCKDGHVLIAFIRERLLMSSDMVVQGRDEISLLGWFLSRGLRGFAAPDPSYHMISLDSATQDIDNYYLHQMGLRTIETPVPSLQGSEVFLKVVEELAGRDAHGWSWIATRFLSLCGRDRLEFSNHLLESRSKALSDGKMHDYSILLEEGGITVASMPSACFSKERDHLVEYCRVKKYQGKRPWWILIVSFADRDEYVAETSYEAGPVVANVELEHLARKLPSSKHALPAPVLTCMSQGLDYSITP